MACSVNAGIRDARLDDAEDIKADATPAGTGARHHVVVISGGVAGAEAARRAAALAPRGLLDAITEGAKAGMSATPSSRSHTLTDSGSRRRQHQETR